MKSVSFRDIEERDLPALKSLIVEAWGDGWNLTNFDQTTDFFQALLETYLSMFLNSGTFGRVAIVEGEVAGAILCSANGEEEKFRQFQKDRISHTLMLLSATERERLDIVEHLSVSFQTIGQLLENRVANYDGSLEFIAITKQAQGTGIGKVLWNEAAAYFKSKNAKSIYLIADSQCNTGFYDHNGFYKVAAKEAVYNYAAEQKKFDIYLYEYKLLP